VGYGVGYMRDHTNWYVPGDAKGEKRCGLHLNCEYALLPVFCELLFSFTVGRVGSPNRTARNPNAETTQSPQEGIGERGVGNGRAACRQVVVRGTFITDGRRRNHQTRNRHGRSDAPGRGQAQDYLCPG